MSDWVAAIVGAVAVLVAGGALWVAIVARGDSKRSSREAKRSADAANEANRIARESKAVAEEANGIAGAANRLAAESGTVAGDSKRIAEAANDLAAKANSLSVKANTLAGESNGIAREALEVSRESAISARESARAAEATESHEYAGLQLQRAERHEQLRPELPPRLQAKSKKDANGRRFLVVEIEASRDYRVAAEAVLEGSTAPASVPPLVYAGRKAEVFVEHLMDGQRDPKVKSLRFRFWPATAADGVDAWTCGCGLPELPDGGRGHWEREVPIFRRPPGTIVTAPIYDRIPGQGPYDF